LDKAGVFKGELGPLCNSIGLQGGDLAKNRREQRSFRASFLREAPLDYWIVTLFHGFRTVWWAPYLRIDALRKNSS
jgi:hypothetical protein